MAGPFDSPQFRERYQFLQHYEIAEKYYDILNHLEHEIYIVDRDYRIIFANDAKNAQYNRPLVGYKCHSVLPVRPQDKPCRNCPVTEVLHKGATRGHIENFGVHTPDGSERYVTETVTPLRDERGECRLAVVACKDITKRVLIEKIKTKLRMELDFTPWQGDLYDVHVRLIVDELRRVGYHRIRFYDVINDTVKRDHLYVLRYSVNMDNLHERGYRFYLKGERYYSSPKDAYKVRIRYGPDVLNKDPRNRAVLELGLEEAHWLHLPLVGGGELIGLMGIDNKGTDTAVTSEDLSLLEDFSEYVAGAIQAIRAEMNLSILDRVSKVINERRTSGEILDIIAREVCMEMEAGMCQILLYSTATGRLERRASYIKDCPDVLNDNLFEEDYHSQKYMTGKVFTNREALNIIDYESLRETPDYEDVTGEVQWEYKAKYEEVIQSHTGKEAKIRNAILAPLVFEDKEIGVIQVSNKLGDGRVPFPDSDVVLVEKVAARIAAVVHGERSKDEVDSAVLKIAASLTAKEYEINEIAQSIVEVVRDLSRASGVYLFLKDDEKMTLGSIAQVGYEEDKSQRLSYSLDIDRNQPGWDNEIGLTALVVITGKSFSADCRDQFADHKSSLDRVKLPEEQNRWPVESLLMEPLKLNQDVIGVLRAQHRRPNAFSKSFKSTFKLLAHFAALAMASAQEIKRKDDFLISLGHELGMPLAGLVSMAEVMLRRYKNGLDEKGVQVDPTMRVSRRRLLDYCDFLRSESVHLQFLTVGRAALDSEATYEWEIEDPRWDIADVVSILRNLAKDKHIDINFDPRAAPPSQVRMDREKLKQAFYNVIHNAIKYSHDGRDIDVRIIIRGRFVRISVQNIGIGVREEDREKIFDMGGRGENATDKDVTGLGRGLYFARMITEKHVGDIELTELDEPTIFTITLPLAFSGRTQ
ncbi:MAG: GAF domain-containing protein [bacterium]